MFARPAALALVVAFLVGAAPAAPADTPPPTAFTTATRSAVLAGAEKAIDGYTFAEKVPALRAAIEANRASYLQIADPEKFANAVTADLYAVAHDKHLRLEYSELALPATGQEAQAAMAARFLRGMEFGNYGYDAAIRLHGNIGYLKLDMFGVMPQSKTAIDSAMTLLAKTDALVIDVRSNGGGDPDSLDYLMGYFYAKPVELTGILQKQNGKSQLTRQFSEAHVSGPRYLGKPLYVLISDRTFSCAEQFAYDMKTLHRATLIGKTTGGGANPGDFVPIDDHFSIFIPSGRAVNPYTNANWEGVGVAPDVATEPAAALLAAYTQALEASHDDIPESAGPRATALKDPAAALQASLPSL